MNRYELEALQTLALWMDEARTLGMQAGLAAASWSTDGNLDRAHYRQMVAWFDDGDPRADDYLPARPDLSGQWADDPTPGSLYEQVTGRDAHGDSSWNFDSYSSVCDALSDAWEAGVDATFRDECERLIRAAAS